MKKILTLSVLFILLSGCDSTDEVTIDDVIATPVKKVVIPDLISVDIDYTETPATPEDNGEITEIENIEYNNQYGLGNINASKIYAEGYTGKGVTVAVIDTGVDIDHPDLIDNISADSYDLIDKDDDASPNGQGIGRSHGTHVAGIIAGMKNGVDKYDIGIHGVAYNSEILALRVGYSSGSISINQIMDAVDIAIDKGAEVINASFGGDFYAPTADKWLLAHNADIVSVHAAGNEGEIDPTYGARTPIEKGYEKLASTLIAVVATDKNNGIASYSNRCGIAQNWCMAAPGSDILSTVDTEDEINTGDFDYMYFSGTSMAAPHVSGAVAVLRSKWPSKSAAETVGILYDTATDLGDPGIDAIYGRGLLNLGNAVTAQGALTIPTVSGDSYTLDNSNLFTSSILGNALDDSIKVAVYDKYKRDYYFDLNTTTSASNLPEVKDELNFKDTTNSVEFESGLKLSSNTTNGLINIQNNIDDYKILFAYKQDPATVFAFNQKTDIEELSDSYTLYGDSHLSHINNAKSVSISNVSSVGNINTSLGFVTGYTDKSNTHNIQGFNISMLAKPVKNLALTAQINHLTEDDTFLSNYFSGAYQTDVAKTKSINLIADAEVNKNLSVIFQTNKGITKVATLDNSAVSDFSAIDSSGYSLSLLGKNIYLKNDKLFATFKQPLKVTDGDMTLTIADGLDADDNIIFSKESVDLSSSNTERLLTVGYLAKVNENIDTVILLNHIDNPNYSLGTESQMMIKISKKF
jgi:subtilisin family serine protease